jgi:flagellar motility protein MotE (MotC chaperone)
MRQYKKILIYTGIALFCFTGFDFFQIKDSSVFIKKIDALAADTQKKEPGKDKKADINPCPECPECPDPAKVVLRGLEDKKTKIDKEQESLVQAKKELEVFEEQIDEKLENLKVLKKQIKEDIALLVKKKTQQEEEKESAYEKKVNRLVKMYAGMRPKKAALIVDEMKLEVAQEIFLRMREAPASQILSYVDSSRAAKISERLVLKRKQ